MAGTIREFGLIGLGRIGGNLAHQALEKGMRVVGYDAQPPRPELLDAGLTPASDVATLCRTLEPPRVVLLYVPAGAAVDQVLDELLPHLGGGDVVVDGGNSYWGDSIRRYRDLAGRGLQLVDAGTSGGVEGARHGACFMVGGDHESVSAVEPLLRALAVDGGYVRAGPPGAGHFVKLVHNGIEFGMLQAIGEGVQLLEHHDPSLPVSEILSCWCNGSVIRSWLVELMAREYRDHDGIGEIPDYVEDTGEVNWLVDDAMHKEIPVPVTALAVMQLIASRDRDRDWARGIAAMRAGFGGHPFGPDEATKRERRQGRIGGFPSDDGGARGGDGEPPKGAKR